MKKWISIKDKRPDKLGWYPVISFDDSRKKSFPDSKYWNRDSFLFDDQRHKVTHFIDEPCYIPAKADEIAFKNDPIARGDSC